MKAWRNPDMALASDMAACLCGRLFAPGRTDIVGAPASSDEGFLGCP
jgi:hypothetical protein